MLCSQVVGGGDHQGSYDAQRCVGKVQSSAGTVRVVCEPASRVSICLPVRDPVSCLRLASGARPGSGFTSCSFQPGRGNMRVHAYQVTPVVSDSLRPGGL